MTRVCDRRTPFIIRTKNIKTMQIIGIDVSKDTLYVALAESKDARNDKVIASHKFANNETGFKLFVDWMKKKKADAGTVCLMEATGVYHEHLADWLHRHGVTVVIELPNKIKHYAKCLNVKTKNDKVDAGVIARYGLHNAWTPWHPMTENLYQMRALLRQVQSMTKERTRCKNQLHALMHSAHAPGTVVGNLMDIIANYDRLIESYHDEVVRLAKEDEAFYARVEMVCTIKGVRAITVLTVLCETDGFQLCQSARQAVSYAGLDVSEYQSGTILKDKRISKKGNARIRHALYLPAMVAGTTGGPVSLMNLYKRVKQKHPTAKKVAIVAVERKLLMLIYTLWKKQEPFDPEKDGKPPIHNAYRSTQAVGSQNQ